MSWKFCQWKGIEAGTLTLGENHHLGEERKSPCFWLFCVHSCPWCLLRLSLGMEVMRGTLLVLFYVSHASASECASLFLPNFS